MMNEFKESYKNVRGKKEKYDASFSYLVNVYQEQFLQQDRLTLLKENSYLKQKYQRYQINQTLQICIDTSSKSQDLLFQQISQLTIEKPSQTKPLNILNPLLNESNNNSLVNQSIFLSQPQPIYFISNTKHHTNQKNLLSYARTPILYQPITKTHNYGCYFSLKGLIRSFYIKILGFPQCISILINIIQYEYQQNNYENIYLLNRYPDNNLIGNILINFLNKIHQMGQVNNYYGIINQINTFKLIDDILCQVILRKLDVFVNLRKEFKKEMVCECFYGLANLFQLICNQNQQVFNFYRDIQNNKRLNSQESNYLIKVHEEISLNPHNNKEKEQFINTNFKQPLFTIYYNEKSNRFQFLIREDIYQKEQNFYSEFKGQKNKEFNSKSSMKIYNKNYDYFDNIHQVLFDPIQSSNNYPYNKPQNKEQLLLNSEESSKQFNLALKKYNKYTNNSKHKSSMLLSQYNSFRESKQFQHKQYKSKKHNQLSRYLKNDSQIKNNLTTKDEIIDQFMI